MFWSGTAGSKVTGLHGAVCSGLVLMAVKLRDCTEPYVLVWYCWQYTCMCGKVRFKLHRWPWIAAYKAVAQCHSQK